MDEKKKYSTIGTVNIGTDEYRDLIESSINAKNEASEYRSKYWAEQKAKKEVETRLSSVEKELSAYADFIANVPEAKALFGQFRAEKALNAYKNLPLGQEEM